MPSQPPKPGHAHLQIRDVPKSDLRALKVAAALAEPPTTTTQLIRDLIHARAMQQDEKPGPATGYKLEYVVTGPAATADYMVRLQDAMIELIESWGGEISGGHAEVDDNGNPVA